MKNDVEFVEGKYKFKYRVNGVVIRDNKVLAVKFKKEDNIKGYYLPGGRVEFGEDSRQALLREMMEETETVVTIESELAVAENFYLDHNGINTLEISMYYIVRPENYNNIKTENYSRIENDKGKLKKLEFEWLDLDNLKNIDFKPEFLKEKLLRRDYTFEHVIKRQ